MANYVTASVTFHSVKHIRASSTRTDGAPLSISLQGEACTAPDSISIFTDDQILTDRLIEAINSVVDQRWHEKQVIEARIAKEGQAYLVQATSADVPTVCDHPRSEQVR